MRLGGKKREEEKDRTEVQRRGRVDLAGKEREFTLKLALPRA